MRHGSSGQRWASSSASQQRAQHAPLHTCGATSAAKMSVSTLCSCTPRAPATEEKASALARSGSACTGRRCGLGPAAAANPPQVSGLLHLSAGPQPLLPWSPRGWRRIAVAPRRACPLARQGSAKVGAAGVRVCAAQTAAAGWVGWPPPPSPRARCSLPAQHPPGRTR